MFSHFVLRLDMFFGGVVDLFFHSVPLLNRTIPGRQTM
jgi:hypothetical protein